MSDEKSGSPEDMSPQAVLARAVAARGDIYPEWSHVIAAAPATFDLLQRTAAHLHRYAGEAASADRLSAQMRELIATPALCAKPDIPHAANHVRKMYRMGLTDRVIFEAAAAFSVVTGVSTILNVACAVAEARNPDYPHGAMPDSGVPSELVPFPELELGRTRTGKGHESLAHTAEWRYAAGLDPGFARTAAAWVDHCMLAGDADAVDALLGPGPRELVAIAALCARGEAGIAADHMRRAYEYKMTRLHVLDAIMSVLPMTGMVTAQIGLRAMQLADAS